MTGRPPLPTTPAFVTGVQWWNRKAVLAMLSSAEASAQAADTLPEALEGARRNGGHVVAWASRVTAEDEARCQDAGIPLVRIEDGFVRSVGLGAGLASAASCVLDTCGIYYDATRPSDLEIMLERLDVSEAERARGARLGDLMRTSRLSKYNVGRRVCERLFPSGREGILVPGQVATDAGIRRTISATIDCATTENVNVDLLRLARTENPGAYIVFKPHPDVAGGLRPGRVPDDIACRFADRVVTDCDIIDAIDQCDKIVTVSSLSGFEGLIRGKAVRVHGTPFYSGWGLTEDCTSLPRRTRRRTLDELLFITLVPYCRYVDPVTRRRCEVEALAERLADLRGSRMRRWIAAARQQVSWLGRKAGL